MKIWIAVLALVSATAFAGPKEELNDRLSLNRGFSADFEQKVSTPEGVVIQEAQGKVEISRPSLFRWTSVVPDENLLVSDGKSLWYYDPFLEQVSIYNQEAATSQTPFVLLTRNQASDWDNYSVSQIGNSFVLESTQADSNQGQFLVDITDKGVVLGFAVVEQDGQKSEFSFKNMDLTVPDNSRFTFVPPVGIEVNDERN
ncbi:outer membrane lipoprotein chaperone LolA [Vibrio tapetis]|uniref:Outer-membrane lipoprotein carrier protein n=1 Tax=Vibrio tapetis subsp. tapetis TaxID=1671868 RepID=A0A2N8ZAX5_9VIBR|nr:outer membrane lipoprotein chaperone LolA [Vibrio tapetis]SON49070.1 chaperone for lipoproteins [Vibrio tapetis subsp. tapetis]